MPSTQNEQRQKRKDEQTNSTPHQLEYFVHVDDDLECEFARCLTALRIAAHLLHFSPRPSSSLDAEVSSDARGATIQLRSDALLSPFSPFSPFKFPAGAPASAHQLMKQFDGKPAHEDAYRRKQRVH